MKKSNINHTQQQIPTLEVASFDINFILSDISEKTASFPKIFKNSPIIIDLSKLVEESGLNAPKQIVLKLAKELANGLKNNGLIPIGFIGLTSDECSLLGLAHFNHVSAETAAPEKDENVATQTNHTKIIDSDLRSGMTAYEKDSDLVIIGDVKRGSEVAAGGNIIIFGKLFGKAHAGCKYPNSVVITTELDPEIVSIGGIYLANQNFDEKDLNKTALITIDEEHRLVVSSC
ncbi:septum site-determining protein MinC [Photobacterium damselae]|uniref:septum site-determining protein MinC n=1 Tax=Photobacterium damselae TaxID=38293 RepID=UPI0040679A90